MASREATLVIARLGIVRGDPMRDGVSDGLDLDDHDSTWGVGVHLSNEALRRRKGGQIAHYARQWRRSA